LFDWGFQLGSVPGEKLSFKGRKQRKRYSPDLISMTLDIELPAKAAKEISGKSGGLVRPVIRRRR